MSDEVKTYDAGTIPESSGRREELSFLDRIKATNYPAARVRIHDRGERGSVRGLECTCYPSGEKSFLLYYKTKAGQERRPKIGSYPEISIGEARRRAKGILDQVAAGGDPKGEWDAEKAELTVDELYQKVMAEFWTKKVSVKRVQDVRQFYTKNLKPRFGGEKLSQVRPAHLRSWLAGFEEKQRTGNASLDVLSRMYDWAIREELIPQGTNPCMLVDRYKNRKRNRKASAEELQRLKFVLDRRWRECPEERPAAAFIYLLLYTGSRPSGIERATWDDLLVAEKDGKTFGVLTFHGKSTSETTEKETVIVPPQAMEILLQLPRLEGAPITGQRRMPKRFWRSIRAEAGIASDLWGRDLRRTFASVGLSNGERLDTIGELLNHRSQETTKIYAKLYDEKKVAAASAIADQIDQITGVS